MRELRAPLTYLGVATPPRTGIGPGHHLRFAVNGAAVAQNLRDGQGCVLHGAQHESLLFDRFATIVSHATRFRTIEVFCAVERTVHASAG